MKQDLLASTMNRRAIFPAIISLLMISSGCIGNTKPDDVHEGGGDVHEEDRFNIIFNSGFEDNSIHVFAENTSAPCTDDMKGIDYSVGNNGDWEQDLENTPFGEGLFCFGGGDRSQRGIDIVQDPDDSNNQAMHMWIVEPAENVSDSDDIACNGEGDGSRKARIQHVLKDNSELYSFQYQVKIRLGASFQTLVDSEYDFNWMTIGEFWNNQPSEEHSFRVTLNLVKPNNVSGTPFYFGLKADKQDEGGSDWNSVWPEEIVSNVEVPIGSWFTLDVTIIEGDQQNGRAIVHATIDGVKSEVANITDWTHAPSDPSPDGFSVINTMKLYTNGAVMCGLNDLDQRLEVWWDDYKIGIPE
jgi:hypothetical protein